MSAPFRRSGPRRGENIERHTFVGRSDTESVDLLTAMLLGASGGVLVLLIFWHGCISRWREARRQNRQRREPEPPLSAFVDPLADVLAGLTQVVLGAAAGAIFHQQVVGVAAAIAVGAAAPALLQQLGNSRTVREAVQGGTEEPAP